MDKDFLFGILAVQLGFASPQQVMVAASAWLADRSKSLPQRLLADGVISEERIKMLEGMVEEALRANGGDVKKSIQALGGEHAVYKSFGGSLVFDEKGEISPAAGTESRKDSTEDAASVTLEHPGRYRFKEGAGESPEIGRGGIGRVFIAFDQHLGREVAIKELLPEYAGESGKGLSTPLRKTSAIVARFLREARVTGQLEHPNILPVHELGRRADGTLYYTMKLVRGKTLAGALKERRTLAERLALLNHVANLCRAIA